MFRAWHGIVSAGDAVSQPSAASTGSATRRRVRSPVPTAAWRRYSRRMSRFGPSQPDLFGPRQPDLFAAPPPEPAPADPDPLDELTMLLDMLRAADRLPWPHLTAAMEAEYRVLFLAKQAGAEGARLASAIMEQTERLFSAAERAGRAM